MAVKFRPNPAGIKQVAALPGLVKEFGDIAARGAERAKEIAPVDSGAYAEGIEGESGIEDGRAIGRINANDFKSLWIEHGTGAPGPTPAYRVLGRTIDGLSV